MTSVCVKCGSFQVYTSRPNFQGVSHSTFDTRTLRWTYWNKFIMLTPPLILLFPSCCHFSNGRSIWKLFLPHASQLVDESHSMYLQSSSQSCPNLFISTIPALVQGFIINQLNWGNRLVSSLPTSPLPPHQNFLRTAASATFLEELKLWRLLAPFLSQKPPVCEVVPSLQAPERVPSSCTQNTLSWHPRFHLSHCLISIYWLLPPWAMRP